MAIVNSVFCGRYTLQAHITVEAGDDNAEPDLNVPAEYEDIWIERLGFIKDGGLQSKLISVLMQEGRINSLSWTLIDGNPTAALGVLGARLPDFDYEPSNPAGQRLRLDGFYTNSHGSLGFGVLVSVGLSHSINR